MKIKNWFGSGRGRDMPTATPQNQHGMTQVSMPDYVDFGGGVAGRDKVVTVKITNMKGYIKSDTALTKTEKHCFCKFTMSVNNIDFFVTVWGNGGINAERFLQKGSFIEINDGTLHKKEHWNEVHCDYVIFKSGLKDKTI